MKPLKLSLTAFGPFKGTETINFNELNRHRLFVISGDTGAGKTTIFDGICFALYGSASGSDREDSRMLRSDFADDQTHTSVELEFELNGRIYRILRQIGHVKSGNKTPTGDRYEFYEKTDGKEVSCVDRQMVSEINQKIESLIGLSQDQFKQIVMLPQGEFRKLLTSDTENKENILRNIFNTESYQELNERLKQKKEDIDESFRQDKQTRDHHIQTIVAALPERTESFLFQVLNKDYYNVNQILDGLDEEINYYEKQADSDHKVYKKAYDTHNEKQNEYHAAKALNDRFYDLEKKESELKELDEQKPSITAKEKQLEAAERASQIALYEKQANEWLENEREKTRAFENAKAANHEKEKALEHAQTTYREEENKQQKRDSVKRQLERLQDYLPYVQAINQEKEHLQNLKKQAEEAHTDLKQNAEKLKTIREKIDNIVQTIQQKNQTVHNLEQKKQALQEKRDQLKVVIRFLELQDTQKNIDQEVQDYLEAYNHIKQKYDQREQAWMHDQASFLAAQLSEGEACPVCGSYHHPQKASNQTNTVTKEEIATIKEELNEKERMYRDRVTTQKSNASLLQEKREELQQLHIPPERASSLKTSLETSGKKLREEVDQLSQEQEQLKKAQETYTNDSKKLKQMEAEQEQLEKKYQEKQTAYDTAKAVYDEKIRQIPEGLQNLSELENQINSVSAERSRLEKAWEDAQANLQQAKNEQTKAAATFSHVESQLKETSHKREQAETAFHSAMKDAGFESAEAYHSAKLSKTSRANLKQTIQQFNEKYAALKQVVHDLKKSLQNKQKADLTSIETDLNKWKEAYESALKQLNLAKAYHDEASNLYTNIKQSHEKVAKREKELARITDLYNMLRGQNDLKISFERYLQIEYLERIIEAANGRLKDLTNGQFYLMRSDKQEARGKQSGLALDIYDVYTGQTRDVKTLSGGEKFNASLCLALGMSDVIQSFKGNVSIETMFIDEGFGSLDDESLNKAIETLIDLQQSGRIIGVISHVHALKSMLPARLDVVKMKGGYSRTEIVAN